MSSPDRSAIPPAASTARAIAQLLVAALLAVTAFAARARAFEQPTAAMLSPLPDAVFTAPATIALEATATGGDGTVALVEYFDGVEQNKIGEATVPPYLFTWTGVEAGVYFLVPFVTNSLGDRNYTFDAPISITVNPPGGPRPLSVSALRGLVPYAFFGRDGFRLRGVLPGLPAGFDPSGLRASVSVGGGVSSFVLDGFGRSLNPSNADGYSFSLHLKGRRNLKTGRIEFPGGDVPFDVKTLFNTFQFVWRDEGVAADVRSADLTFVVTVGLAGQTYTTSVPVHYTTAHGKLGRFSLQSLR